MVHPSGCRFAEVFRTRVLTPAVLEQVSKLEHLSRRQDYVWRRIIERDDSICIEMPFYSSMIDFASVVGGKSIRYYVDDLWRSHIGYSLDMFFGDLRSGLTSASGLRDGARREIIDPDLWHSRCHVVELESGNIFAFDPESEMQSIRRHVPVYEAVRLQSVASPADNLTSAKDGRPPEYPWVRGYAEACRQIAAMEERGEESPKTKAEFYALIADTLKRMCGKAPDTRNIRKYLQKHDPETLSGYEGRGEG